MEQKANGRDGPREGIAGALADEAATVMWAAIHDHRANLP